MKQVSITRSITCYGIGVHYGQNTQLTLKPAAVNTGVMFIRTDVSSRMNYILASYKNVIDTTLSTTIANEYKVSVATIEHLMAAIWGCGIDNIIIELDGPEVPIMDGSSKPFVFMIEYAGIKFQSAPKKFIKIIKEIKCTDGNSEIIIAPLDKEIALDNSTMQIDMTIDFQNQVIGKQHFQLSEKTSFIEEIADARTFGFLHELEYLRNQGLAKGASLQNAIGIDNDVILNHDGLRYKNEFVRHKLLDFLGDCYTSGVNIIGQMTCHKTGHALNNKFIHQLLSDNTAYHNIAIDTIK